MTQLGRCSFWEDASAVERWELTAVRVARPSRLRGRFLVLSLAVACAALAIWATLDAGFLRYPGWLAAQKADLVLGPVAVGLYWRRVRPASRFGWLLVAFGLMNVAYVAQSSTN